MGRRSGTGLRFLGRAVLRVAVLVSVLGWYFARGPRRLGSGSNLVSDRLVFFKKKSLAGFGFRAL